MADSYRVDYKTLSPYVRFVHEAVIPAGNHMPERYIYDQEFMLVVSGSGRLRIENREYAMKPGDFLYIRPQRRNEMFVVGQEPMRCFAVHFDHVFMGEAIDFSPSVYLGRRQDETLPDVSLLRARPSAELLDLEIPERMRPDRFAEFHEAFRELTSHFQESRADAHIWLKSCMLRILGLVYLELTTNEGIRIGNPNADLVQDAIAYIRKHYAEKVELPALAARAGLSPKYFGTLFKRATGKTVSQFLLGLRMEEAKKLLRTNKHAIAEIADRVGIGDLFYFSKLFKKSEGLSPKKYAESIGYRHSPSS